MDTIIFDIDGTLADVSHRRHHVAGGKREWDQFFDKMVDDPPLADVCFLAEALADWAFYDPDQLKLFVFSGRPETHRAQTMQWLYDNVPALMGNTEAVLMRAAGDYRPDTEVKREMLHGIQGQGYNVRLVIDDRPSVIEMWKSEGLTVLAHDSGEWDPQPLTSPGILTLMVGPSGAGKSHYISKYCYGPVGTVIGSDALRNEMCGDFKNQSMNDQVFAALHALVKARITSGLNTIVDATNLRARDRRAIRDLVPADTSIHYFVIDRPLVDKHSDAGWRDEVVIKGVKLIDKHHQAFQSALKHILR